MASEKEISLDLVGTFDHGATFYMVSKLTEVTSRLKKALMTEHAGTEFGIQDIVGKEDRTVHYLVLTDCYRDRGAQSLAYSQELVLSNGMVRKVRTKRSAFSHDRVNNYGDVALAHRNAPSKRAALTILTKERMRNAMHMPHRGSALTPSTIFCAKRKDGEKLAKQLVEINDPANGKLIGGDLDWRAATSALASVSSGDWSTLSPSTRRTTAQTQNLRQHLAFPDRPRFEPHCCHSSGKEMPELRDYMQFLESSFTNSINA